MTDYSATKESFLSNFKRSNSNLNKYKEIIKSIKNNDNTIETHFITDITIENHFLSFNFLGRKLNISFDIRLDETQINSFIVCSLINDEKRKEFFTIEISDSYLINRKLNIEIPYDNNLSNLLLYCTLNNLASKIRNKDIE